MTSHWMTGIHVEPTRNHDRRTPNHRPELDDGTRVSSQFGSRRPAASEAGVCFSVPAKQRELWNCLDEDREEVRISCRRLRFSPFCLPRSD
jgi:hypothetical protein